MIPYDTPIDPDVQVAQILYIQRCRQKIEAEHKAERKKLRRARLNRAMRKVGQALTVTAICIVSILLITCVVVGAMYLSGGLR